VGNGTLWRVVAPRFVAGLVTVGERVTEAAPILRWTVGRTRAELRAYFARRGWAVSRVSGEG
jgi:hypothetical protein